MPLDDLDREDEVRLLKYLFTLIRAGMTEEVSHVHPAVQFLNVIDSLSWKASLWPPPMPSPCSSNPFHSISRCNCRLNISSDKNTLPQKAVHSSLYNCTRKFFIRSQSLPFYIVLCILGMSPLCLVLMFALRRSLTQIALLVNSDSIYAFVDCHGPRTSPF